jgi:hypothetical protein
MTERDYEEYYLGFSNKVLFLLSHKAAIFKTAKICEQSHGGDSRTGTGWRAWIAWLWRRVGRVLQTLSRV